MSDFSAVAVIIALLLVDVFVHLYLERWFEERVDTIVTGVIRGVPVPIEHRWMLHHNKYMSDLYHIVSAGAVNGVSIPIKNRWATLHNQYNHQCVAAALSTILLGILEVLVARTISSTPFRYFGYLHAFAVFTTVFSVIVLSILNYRHLASVLRQAEAD
jgi:hypothetical protein